MVTIKLFNADNVNIEPAYTIVDGKVYGSGSVDYSIVGNTVYKGSFGGGMVACTFDEEHIYSGGSASYTVSGDKIYQGPFAGGIVAYTIVREED